ncbi:Usher syndrome type-1G protein [Biomphalaria pfeifferi]|uniref:Usher syndrome type-1G protein n=1 Tax=Biomphalaria pfeifferi TaxID=112525 RepID=A0AAD8FAM3_BIOPF|nr:Usher syndrome type-1G protein [Biomphalaria pfeifferi]
MVERFINAAKDGYVDLLREATRKDLNTADEDGMTATLWAAANGNLEALRLIVGREGDVDKSDYMGYTALHHAVSRGHMGVVSYLVNWGCNIYALDNDLHSALDIASMHNRPEIVRFLDIELARRQSKNPRQVAKLKEEALRTAESNIKKYEKRQEDAAKRAEKEQKKLQKEIEEGVHRDNRPRKSIFESLTMRMKKNPVNNVHKNTGTQRKYSEFSGTSSQGNNLFARKLHNKRLESMGSYAADVDTRGRARKQSQGIVGLTSDVIYVTSSQNTGGGEIVNGRANRRPTLDTDMFMNTKISRAKSESDLLDEFGEDSGLGEEEYGPFNLGKRTFLTKMPFLHPIHSFDDSMAGGAPDDMDDIVQGQVLGQGFLDERNELTSKHLPWDQDDLDNLDDDDDKEDEDEMSTVNMFLWSCGAANWLNIFAQEKIDMALLTKMTDEELKDLGIPFGPRKKLREAINRRNLTLQSPSRMVDTYL